MEYVSRYEVAPFSALINMIKYNYYENSDIYNTLLAVLCDYDPNDDKSKERTVHYIELLLSENRDLADCLVSFLPTNNTHNVKQLTDHRKSTACRRIKIPKQTTLETVVEEEKLNTKTNKNGTDVKVTAEGSKRKTLKLMDPSSIQEVIRREITPSWEKKSLNLNNKTSAERYIIPLSEKENLKPPTGTSTNQGITFSQTKKYLNLDDGTVDIRLSDTEKYDNDGLIFERERAPSMDIENLNKNSHTTAAVKSTSAPVCTVVPSQNLPKVSSWCSKPSVLPNSDQIVDLTISSSGQSLDQGILVQGQSLDQVHLNDGQFVDQFFPYPGQSMDHILPVDSQSWHGSSDAFKLHSKPSSSTNEIFYTRNVSADFNSCLFPDFSVSFCQSQEILNPVLVNHRDSSSVIYPTTPNLHVLPKQHSYSQTGTQNYGIHNVPTFNSQNSSSITCMPLNRSQTPLIPFQTLNMQNPYLNNFNIFSTWENSTPTFSSQFGKISDNSSVQAETNFSISTRKHATPVYLGTSSNLASFPYTQQITLHDGKTQNKTQNVYFKGSSIKLPHSRERVASLIENNFQGCSENHLYSHSKNETIPFQSENMQVPSNSTLQSNSSLAFPRAFDNSNIKTKTVPKKYTIAPNQVARKRLRLTPASSLQNQLGIPVTYTL